MCPHAPMCVLILLYICPHTPPIWLSSCCYICVLILLFVLVLVYMCALSLLWQDSLCKRLPLYQLMLSHITPAYWYRRVVIRVLVCDIGDVTPASTRHLDAGVLSTRHLYACIGTTVTTRPHTPAALLPHTSAAVLVLTRALPP
jgi:hypothetical protein